MGYQGMCGMVARGELIGVGVLVVIVLRRSAWSKNKQLRFSAHVRSQRIAQPSSEHRRAAAEPERGDPRESTDDRTA